MAGKQYELQNSPWNMHAVIVFVLLWYCFMDSYNTFTNTQQGCLTGIGTIVQLSFCQRSNWTHLSLVPYIWNTKYEIFIASGTNIKYMETTCNKDMENNKQN